jgi:hypothetical protein
MKLKNLILAFCLFSMLSNSFGQQKESDAITSALKSGDASILSQFFINNLDLTLLDEDDVFSKSQAETMLNNFFAKNTPKSISIDHQGTSKLQDHYTIGTISTTKGKYRFTFFLKKMDDKYLIKQLRIETAN